jgi:hypothetical protein
MWKSAKMRGIMAEVYGFGFPPYARNPRQEITPVMTFSRCRLTKYFLNLLLAVLSLTLFASAEGKEKVLYSFQGGTNDGEYPAGGVVFDKAGNLYGATTDGGGECPPAQCGIVFQLSPPAKNGDPWTETVLHIFKGNASGDGNTPVGSVIIDTAGNLYGTTGYGGTGNCVLLGDKVGCGTVYELSPPTQKGGAWTETVLYSFPTPKQGYLPNGNLVFDKAGNLYGATMFGGGYGTTCDPYYQYCGTAFELSPPKKQGGAWTEKLLHGFRGGTDGANPNGGLVFDGKGAIYGTTYSGGSQNCKYESEIGCGVTFELRPPTKKGENWSEKVLYRFDRTNSDGGNPMSGLVYGTNGRLYGTTLNGGPEGGGIAFCLTPPHKESEPWSEKVLHGFGDNVFGYDLEGPLVFDASGNLYGAANTGSGSAAYGNVFQLKPNRTGDKWGLGVVYDFAGVPDGGNPAAGLIFDGSRILYGTTQSGGSGTDCGSRGCGTVFQVSP